MMRTWQTHSAPASSHSGSSRSFATTNHAFSTFLPLPMGRFLAPEPSLRQSRSRTAFGAE
ncbi:hypothetical protein COCNU_11G002740 [Cocos nucifera]|uniref:Uncharacterized protein n=1 Tax=Cocos nucifera TaxID=13894 RepID=A0A8K0INH4_COCNU|nr:hypothetical protein COCNU_11G002740 [Cocos nucifera]